MAKTNAPGDSRLAGDYILVAIVNTGRASAVRNLALDFCSNVVVLRDGQSAIDQIDRSGPPRLLVTELSLPRVDGFGVLRHLRRTVAGARAGAIVVSSHDALRKVAMKIADSLGIAQILPLNADRSALRRAIADTMNVKDPGSAPARRTHRPAPHDAASLE